MEPGLKVEVVDGCTANCKCCNNGLQYGIPDVDFDNV